ncbi:MAG TPA: gliding motility-associated ABC transporter substrate-binding protein GldG [Flavobacteriales bacterium]|nr:gliding motility-associated ABC transporter substrate-binding protein GldG [Flavobacteriales bacterium]|tara:strand:- start:54091 stop:55818 length:1728 start_codon:yes stop_codon:yes gene_type:complete
MVKTKRQDIINLIAGVAVIILLNYVASFVFYRFDLTSEKRYTLSEPTKNILQNLDDVVFIKVYLEGDFPAGFKRLHDETKEMLDEFRAYSNGNLEYEFINPAEDADKKTKEEIYKQLYKKGLRPTDLEVKEENGISNKVIWPGAIITYKGKERAVNLLKSRIQASPEEILNSSIESLEFELAYAIKALQSDKKPSVAFIQGHGELDELHTAALNQNLKEFYDTKYITIDGKLSTLTERLIVDSTQKYAVFPKFDAIIIAKPQEKISNKDKFIIDQYIMHGGKVLWLIDPVYTSMDSLRSANYTMAIIQDLNIEDQLFDYGARVNPNLVQDLQCAPIPVVTGYIGNQPKYNLMPWIFFPMLMPSGSHPIVNNINYVKGEFTSTVDTIAKKGIKKSVLLHTSQYTKLVNAPTRISLALLRIEPNPKQFNKGKQPVAVLLEGQFNSSFTNRIPPQLENSKEINFKDKSTPTKMIVVADGDIAKNDVNRNNQIYNVGFDKYTKQQYGNDEFLLNSINYLVDDSGIMNVRSRKLKLRLLNKAKVKEERLKWQLINTIIPVILVILFGIIFNIIRKRKYAS